MVLGGRDKENQVSKIGTGVSTKRYLDDELHRVALAALANVVGAGGAGEGRVLGAASGCGHSRLRKQK